MPEDFDRALGRMRTELMLTQLKRALHDPQLSARDVLTLTDRILELQVGR